MIRERPWSHHPDHTFLPKEPPWDYFPCIHAMLFHFEEDEYFGPQSRAHRCDHPDDASAEGMPVFISSSDQLELSDAFQVHLLTRDPQVVGILQGEPALLLPSDRLG